MLAPVPEGLEPGTPFSVGVVALAMYLRFVCAISHQRLSRLLLELFGLSIPLDALASGSEGTLDAAFRRGKPAFDADVAAILVRLRRTRVVCSDETSVRVAGRTCWNWVFPAETLGFSENSEVVVHVIRSSRSVGAREVLDGHRPALWVSDPYGAQLGHAENWQICPAHQPRPHLRDRSRRRRVRPAHEGVAAAPSCSRDGTATWPPSTRREYRRRLECALDAVMALAPTHRDGQRLRKRCGKLRSHLFTFLDHPELPADNNGSGRELRPTATYRKVTGGFRSTWGADLFAGVRSVIGTAARRGRLPGYPANTTRAGRYRPRLSRCLCSAETGTLRMKIEASWDRSLDVLCRRVIETENTVGAAWPYYADPVSGVWATTEDGDWCGGHWVEALRIVGELTEDDRLVRRSHERSEQLRPYLERETSSAGIGSTTEPHGSTMRMAGKQTGLSRWQPPMQCARWPSRPMGACRSGFRSRSNRRP